MTALTSVTSSGRCDVCEATLFDCWCCVFLPHTALRSAAASAQGTPGDIWRYNSQFTGGNWEEWEESVCWEEVYLVCEKTDVLTVFMYSVPHPSCMFAYLECSLLVLSWSSYKIYRFSDIRHWIWLTPEPLGEVTVIVIKWACCVVMVPLVCWLFVLYLLSLLSKAGFPLAGAYPCLITIHFHLSHYILVEFQIHHYKLVKINYQTDWYDWSGDWK